MASEDFEYSVKVLKMAYHEHLTFSMFKCYNHSLLPLQPENVKKKNPVIFLCKLVKKILPKWLFLCSTENVTARGFDQQECG